MNKRLVLNFFRFLAVALLPDIAFAYVGPGAGLSAIGTVLALIGAILLGIVGFVWYPVKRLLRGKPTPEPEEVDDKSDDVTADAKQIETESLD